jgi:hypothetical protein
MGLDVTAFQEMKLINACRNEDGEIIDPETGKEVESAVEIWDNTDFPGRAAPLHSKCVYSYEEAMAVPGQGYGGFSNWRETLAKISGWPLTEYESWGAIKKWHSAGAWAATEGPFWELINFSDCEGFIGTDACKKLCADFAQYKEAASKEDGNFYTRYLQWHEAVIFASANGALQFH